MKRKKRKAQQGAEPKRLRNAASPKTANRALALQTRKALLQHYRKRYRVFSR